MNPRIISAGLVLAGGGGHSRLEKGINVKSYTAKCKNSLLIRNIAISVLTIDSVSLKLNPYSKFSEQESSLRYPSASQNRVKVWRHCRKRSAPGRSSDEKSSLKRESALTNEGVGTVVSGN